MSVGMVKSAVVDCVGFERVLMGDRRQGMSSYNHVVAAVVVVCFQ